MNKNFFDAKTIKNLRKSIGLSVKDFWNKYDVPVNLAHQYENENAIPEGLAILIYLDYVKGLDLNALRQDMKNFTFEKIIGRERV